jgi:hypothetical protein
MMNENVRIGFISKKNFLKDFEIEGIKKYFLDLRKIYSSITVLHGGSDGAETVLHKLAVSLDFEVNVYPSIDGKNRLIWRSLNLPNVKIFPDDQPKERYKKIILQANILIIAPEGRRISRNDIWGCVDKAERLRMEKYIPDYFEKLFHETDFGILFFRNSSDSKFNDTTEKEILKLNQS